MSTGALVICFGPLGRFVDALAAVQRLRAQQAHNRLTLLTAPGLAGLARASSLFDDVSTIELPLSPAALKALVKALRKRRFARIYDLERSQRTLDIQNAFKFFPPPFAGAAPNSKWRLDSPPPHPVDADARLLDLAGIGGRTPLPAPGPDARWLLRRRLGAPSLEPAFFGLERSFVLLNLTREDDGPRWPAERFAELARRVTGARLDCALTGTMADRAIARAVAGNNGQIKDLCARADVYQLAALGARALGVIGHSGGAARLACAAGGRVLSLHQGHADAAASAPRGAGAVALVSTDLARLDAAQVLRTLGMFEPVVSKSLRRHVAER